MDSNISSKKKISFSQIRSNITKYLIKNYSFHGFFLFLYMKPIFMPIQDVNSSEKVTSVNHFHGLDRFLNIFKHLTEKTAFRGHFQSEFVTQ